jgi:S1-C subfamily serine protease
MRLFGRNLLVLAVVGTVAAMIFGGGGIVLAGGSEDGDHVKVVHKGRVMVVTVDEDGERHEEVIELDGNGPRAFLGVQLEEGPDTGAVITEVIEDTAAERAGLREGDVIVSIDGEELDGSWAVTKSILKKEPGENVELEIIRDGRRETVTAELGERKGLSNFVVGEFDSEEFEKQMELLEQRLEDLEINLEGLDENLEDFHIHLDEDFDVDMDELHDQLEDLHIRIEKDLDLPELRHKIITITSDRPVLGVTLVQPTAELRRHLGGPEEAGVLVSKVLSGMPAEDAGVEVGDLIVAIDGKDVEDTGDLVSGLKSKHGERVELEIVRDRRSLSIDAFLPEREEETD